MPKQHLATPVDLWAGHRDRPKILRRAASAQMGLDVDGCSSLSSAGLVQPVAVGLGALSAFSGTIATRIERPFFLAVVITDHRPTGAGDKLRQIERIGHQSTGLDRFRERVDGRAIGECGVKAPRRPVSPVGGLGLRIGAPKLVTEMRPKARPSIARRVQLHLPACAKVR